MKGLDLQMHFHTKVYVETMLIDFDVTYFVIMELEIDHVHNSPFLGYIHCLTLSFIYHHSFMIFYLLFKFSTISFTWS